MAELKPHLLQIMNGLIEEVRFGKAALRIAIGLNYADPDAWAVAPLFFGLSRQANLEVAQMYAAKLCDKPTKKKTPVTIRTLLNLAKKQPMLFTKGSHAEVIEAANKCWKIISGLKVPLASIEKRRHESLAHLDANSVMNPGQLKHTAPLTLADLEKIFEGTEEILRSMDRFFTGLVGEIIFLEQDDYRAVLRIAADAKRSATRSASPKQPRPTAESE